jgi:HAD superfamily hydrolase (TIGR01549 family)
VGTSIKSSLKDGFVAANLGYPFRFVLFDFEGTLVDFQWDLRNAVAEAREALVHIGYPLSSPVDNYALLRNDAVLSAYERGLDKREVVRCINEVYDRYDRDALTRWSLQPGVPGLLRELQQRQVRIGLVTNIGRKAIEQALTRLQLAEYINAVVTRNDVDLLKPSGEGVKTALQKLGADNSATLFVGDSVADILAAREAGVQVAIVCGGESDPNSLAAASPTFQFQSIRDLIAWRGEAN